MSAVASSVWGVRSRLLPLVVVFYGATGWAAPPVGQAIDNDDPARATSAVRANVNTSTVSTASWVPTRMDIRALQVPDGYQGAVASSIDAEGRIYGYAFNGTSFLEQVRRAVKWSPGGLVTKVGPDNATDGAVIGMMDSKLVYWAKAKENGVDKINAYIGTTVVPNFVARGIQGSKVYGWKYSNATFTNGGGYIWPTGESYTTVSGLVGAMNANGVIAGTGRIPQHMYSYELVYGTTTSFNLIGRFGAFLDMDRNGVAVGYRSIVPNSPSSDIRAVRFKPNSVDQDLGTFGGPESGATAVTLDGESVVGWAQDSSTARKAFLWRRDHLYALETLVDYPPPTLPPPGTSAPTPTPQMWLSEANGINEKNEIVGVGYSQGKAIPFVLKPKTATGVVAVDSNALKVHIALPSLPAIAVERKVVMRSKQ